MSAAMDSNIQEGRELKTVYVRLLNEGTSVLRPALGEYRGARRYLLLAPPEYNAESETWEFVPGTMVLCEQQRIDGDLLLIATAAAE
jgi:hypothetical protein